MDAASKGIPIWRRALGAILALTAVGSWAFFSWLSFELFELRTYSLLFFLFYQQIGLSLAFLVAYAFRNPGPNWCNVIVATVIILAVFLLSVIGFFFWGVVGAYYWFISSVDAAILLVVTAVAFGALWGLVPWRSQGTRSEPKNRQLVATGLWPSIGIGLIVSEFLIVSLVSWTGYLEVRRFGLKPEPELIKLILEERGAEEIIEEISRGADLDEQDILLRTALSVAASKGDSRVAQLLVEAGADPNITDMRGNTALHEAAGRRDNTEIVKVLIGAGANPRKADSGGWTPLHEAALGGSLGIAQLLIDAGADPNAQSDFDASVLHIASIWCHPDVVDLLLDSDADPHLRNARGQTALNDAIEHCENPTGLRDVVQALLAAHSDVNALDASGVSALHYAAGNSSDRQLFVMLIASGASLETLSRLGWSPLGYAARIGSPAAVKALLDAGADPYRVDKDHSSAIHAAIWKCYSGFRARREEILEMLGFLLDLGIDPQARDAEGRTALDLAEDESVKCGTEVAAFLRERM